MQNPAFTRLSLPNVQSGLVMEEDRTPVEARGGVISGRVALVLISSFVGAVVAVALCWAFLIPHA